MFGLFGGKNRRIKTLESDLDWEKRRSAASENLAKGWENDYRRAVQEKDALIATLNTRTEDANKAHDRIAVLDDALAVKESECQLAQAEFECAEFGVRDQTRLKEKAWGLLQQAQMSLLQRKNQVGDLATELGMANARITELEGDISILKRDIGEKNRHLESNSDIIKLQSGRITELEKERDDIRNDLLGRLDLAKADIDEKDSTIAKIQESQSSMLEIGMDHSRARSALLSYAVKLFGFWRIEWEMREDQAYELDSVRSDRDVIIRERDSAKASLEEAQKDFRQQAAQINTQTGLNRDEMNRLKRESSEKDERIGALEAEIEKMNARPYARLRNEKGQFMSREELAAQADNPSDCD